MPFLSPNQQHQSTEGINRAKSNPQIPGQAVSESQIILDFAAARDDGGGGGDKRNSMTCKAPVKSNQH